MTRTTILMMAFLSSCTVMPDHSQAVTSMTSSATGSAKRDMTVTAAINKTTVERSRFQSSQSVLAYGGPSPWICTPSGFGMKSQCTSKASLDY